MVQELFDLIMGLDEFFVMWQSFSQETRDSLPKAMELLNNIALNTEEKINNLMFQLGEDELNTLKALLEGRIKIDVENPDAIEDSWIIVKYYKIVCDKLNSIIR